MREFSTLVIALTSLFATGPVLGNQQALAVNAGGGIGVPHIGGGAVSHIGGGGIGVSQIGGGGIARMGHFGHFGHFRYSGSGGYLYPYYGGYNICIIYYHHHYYHHDHHRFYYHHYY
jgi:hypothetical protein